MNFRDLDKQYQHLKPEIDQAISDVLKKSQFIGGEPVRQLEAELAEYVSRKHCITCANGTDALTLVLKAWGVGKGDAVFVPDFTFFSTAEAPASEGAIPIFVDVLEDTFNMNPASLETAIKTVIKEGKLTPKVIIPVDLFGLPADYPKILGIANKYNLKVLEDGAQGFGGSINGKMACSFGDASTTSFFPAKPLGCYGDGGAVFTDDDETAELIRSIAIHGKGNIKYDNIRLGMNSRLDTIQAAILRVKLNAFKSYELKQVNEVAYDYTQLLKGIVKTPIVPEGYYSSWAQYTILLKDKNQRNNFKNHLQSNDIPVMIYYSKFLHEQQAFRNIYSSHSSGASELCNRVLSLPVHPYLSTDIIQNITSVIKKI